MDGLPDLEFVVAHGALHAAGKRGRPPMGRSRKPLLLEIIRILNTNPLWPGKYLTNSGAWSGRYRPNPENSGPFLS
jgi:hypothetical protein